MSSLGPLAEPLARFAQWWQEAREKDPAESSSAMVLSSVDERGRPSSRVVLLRGFGAGGFTFFTNLQSRKARELLATRVAALNFYWPTLGRQVRAEGTVEQVPNDEADAYFNTRPRDSQLGAWASDQSRLLVNREELLRRLEETRLRFEGQDVPRPAHWSGLRVVPDAIELWEEGAFRLHTRERFERLPVPESAWTRTLLFP